MTKPFEDRLLDLIKEDPELHKAMVEFIEAQTKAKIALAELRNRRK